MKDRADAVLAKIKELEVYREMEEYYEIDEQYVASKPDDQLGDLYFDARAMLAEVLEELNEQGKLDFWLIKHPQIQKFWAVYQERKRIRKIHTDAVDKLRSQFTEEELRILKIRIPGK